MNSRELMDEVVALRGEVGRLHSKMRQLEAQHAAAPAAETSMSSPQSRRNLLKLVTVALAGAIGARISTPLPVAATTSTFTLGTPNTEDTITSLGTTGNATSPNPLIQFTGGGAAAPASTQQGLNGAVVSIGQSGADGLDGYAAGAKGYGVLGQSDAGYGIVGAADTGVDLAGLGTGRIQVRAPNGLSGAPSWAPPVGRYEMVRDNSGALWLSMGDGTANWRRWTALTSFPTPRRCFGDGTTYAADAVITNIDAKTIIASKGGGSTGVPAGALAAYCAVQSYQPGVMTLYPAGSADPGLGNWACQGTSAGTGVQMLYMLVPLSGTGLFNIHNNFTAKQIFVDVWGYLF